MLHVVQKLLQQQDLHLKLIICHLTLESNSCWPTRIRSMQEIMVDMHQASADHTDLNADFVWSGVTLFPHINDTITCMLLVPSTCLQHISSSKLLSDVYICLPRPPFSILSFFYLFVWGFVTRDVNPSRVIAPWAPSNMRQYICCITKKS